MLYLVFQASPLVAQEAPAYWGTQSQLQPWRLPLTTGIEDLTYQDLDQDGDPDVLTYQLGDISVKWIDDDDDMQMGDIEGDLDSDCLLTDLNGDGIFGGPHDLIIDWNDENGDQVADLQVFIQQTPNDEAFTSPDEGEGFYLWQIDYDEDGNFQPIDWRGLATQGAQRGGIPEVFADYSGDITFTQARVATYNLKDLAYNWENPYHGYDPDQDGLTEYSIRFEERDLMEDTEQDLPPQRHTSDYKPNFAFAGQVNHATISFDADNENDPERAFDFDFSIDLRGPGFQYGAKEAHRFKSMRGLPGTDSLFYDPRFRQIDQLYFARRKKAQRMMFQDAVWEQATFVFDEDNDCRHWDGVPIPPPSRPLASRSEVYDLNGDRAEWDLDCSGKGQLYLSPLDGRLHLFGAESGIWQINQNSQSLHHRPWQSGLEEQDMVSFLYQDTDSNGFVDEIRIDLDGDQQYDEILSARALGINDAAELIDPSRWTYLEVYALFKAMASHQWEQAQLALQTAQAYGLNPQWYAAYTTPKSLQQKYAYGFWLCFYIYHDLDHLMRNDLDRQNDLYQVRRAYLSSDWSLR